MICGAYTEYSHVWHLHAALIYIGGTRKERRQRVMKEIYEITQIAAIPIVMTLLCVYMGRQDLLDDTTNKSTIAICIAIILYILLGVALIHGKVLG